MTKWHNFYYSCCGCSYRTLDNNALTRDVLKLFWKNQIVGNCTVNSDTRLALRPVIFELETLCVPNLRDCIARVTLFQLRVDFPNQLTNLELRLCQRFKSFDELPVSLKAVDTNNTMSLEWILTGSTWKLSKRLECYGRSKLLQKNPSGNPRKKLIKVSLSLSLSKFDRTGFSGP